MVSAISEKKVFWWGWGESEPYRRPRKAYVSATGRASCSRVPPASSSSPPYAGDRRSSPPVAALTHRMPEAEVDGKERRMAARRAAGCRHKSFVLNPRLLLCVSPVPAAAAAPRPQAVAHRRRATTELDQAATGEESQRGKKNSGGPSCDLLSLRERISGGASYSGEIEVEKLKLGNNVIEVALVAASAPFLSNPAIPDDDVLVAMKFYLEILFLENSLPLHRTLISVLVKCKKYCSVISGCFASLCEEYGGSGSKAKKRFLFISEGLFAIPAEQKDQNRSSWTQGPRCKGRYIPLASLTKRLGAKSLLRDECWNDDGVEQGYDAFRVLCLPPLLRGLISGNSKLRSNLNTYALPAVIEVDADSIFAMLGFINIGPSAKSSKLDVALKNDQCVAALVSLLKVSRNLALVEGDIDLDPDELSQQEANKCAAVISVRGVNVTVPVKWFVLALTHNEESLRIDAAESLFINPKTSSLPSSLELSLLKEAVPLNMRCSSTAFQMKWTSLFRKFFARVRTALDRQVKLGLWLPSSLSSDKDSNCSDTVKATTFQRAEDLFQFMKWLSSFLFNSCYPSGPYERKTIAMDLILTLLDVWPICRSEGKNGLYPYNDSITLPDSTISFVGSIIDSWDRLRENSFRILLQFPTPLPGISTSASINGVIRWAKKLVLSPRVRESDAGALTFRLVFRKYVLEFGCVLVFSKESDCLQCYTKSTNDDTEVTSQNPVAQYITSLIKWLCAVVEEAEKDLYEACKKSFVHGVLLTLRYTFDELDWNSEVLQSCIAEMRCLVEKLLQLIMRVTSLALWVVSSDAWYMPYDVDDMVDDGSFLSDIIDENQPHTVSEIAESNTKSGHNGKPADHIVMVGCWLAMKEVSLLFGTIIRKIPLPGCSHSNSSHDGFAENTEETNHHNGAIDKTRAGFTALCNRLLCSNDSRLCKMIESWMMLLMDRTVVKGQTVDDLLRRSAGIPAAFIALFLAEPEGTPKKLLPRALEWLIEFAKTSLADFQKDCYQNLETGVVPTVHVFNVLRAAFNDANLATDTSGFCAEAAIVAIRAFSSPYWEVRNAACLAYTALVRRMVGFLNVHKRESARRSITGLEFFHRYPALHPFLFSELKVATDLLADGLLGNLEAQIAKAIHPSLCPILILLSRLKPSPISRGTDDSLDPFLLLPFIQRCATQSNYRVRVLASRALIGLVSNERLQHVVDDILHDLPCGSHEVAAHHALCSDPLLSANTENGNLTLPVKSSSFNSVHGLLLQLSSLLDKNFRALTDSTKKYQILSQLVEVLSKCSWLGCTKLCACPVVSTSYLRVLDLMLDVARTGKSGHIDAIQTLLSELSYQCLNIGTSTHYSFHDPTQIELRQQAAASYFSCAGLPKRHDETTEEDVPLQILDTTSSISEMRWEVSLPELHKEIMSCLADPTYDVRITVLKRILQLAKSARSGDSKNICTSGQRTICSL
ncbi:hypothetical protein GUJ93_ZPchr0130g6516 [Zizania palustris]|uniref:DUF2428 domain-containing protein n=1 Tax=Zizania palustris TaxID=103762 RepID=A0A8J5R1Q2_ZIZPA|nr:hypothetical protein GUJ93_ZPchr0130g6516 [Zizania palustris]